MRDSECGVRNAKSQVNWRTITFRNPHSEEGPKYVATYIGPKQKLVDWICPNTPDGVKSAFDAFCGSAVVGCMFKTKGLCVVANDRLRYAFRTARAIIENKSARISDEEMQTLLADLPSPRLRQAGNPKAGDFVQKTFKGIYFTLGVQKVIDHIRASIDALNGYNRDIGLFARCGPLSSSRSCPARNRQHYYVLRSSGAL